MKTEKAYSIIEYVLREKHLPCSECPFKNNDVCSNEEDISCEYAVAMAADMIISVLRMELRSAIMTSNFEPGDRCHR